ncbi:inorganic phosphate transporter [Stakelama marina]|uniref:Phosphate transporter n=1 Tax=Stakelama marina TaxID=2826939 RepID=A0A8T4ICG4_9SPHN|nr:inorganic phosphate transporter [Stakelama marina]MBR0551792.1 inorganic phosphate transporter [Stakelama marina]
MATAAIPQSSEAGRIRLDTPNRPIATWIFAGTLVGGLIYAATSVLSDTRGVGETLALGVFAFLGLALVIALGFEFVNGFHDTANAVATVIYTRSMSPAVAVIWSGAFNFLGVMVSSGAVAYSIITLLPVELILNVGSAAGFAMIFALLLAAVIWNVATWYVGLPNSSSHSLIGSILGVGLANQLIEAGSKGGTAGVDWGQAEKVLSALLFSPMLGFGAALVLMFTIRVISRRTKKQVLLQAPHTAQDKPPRGIRALLIFTCTAVSFAHGGNDGQKGMGLIMLILIGCAPTAYALNRTMPAAETASFVQVANQASQLFEGRSGSANVPIVDARKVLADALQKRKADSPAVYAALGTVSHELSVSVEHYGALSKVPAQATRNLRNDMYLVLDTSRLITKSVETSQRFSATDLKTIDRFQTMLEAGTRFIPFWVKVIVAIALGLGTMVGWKRIVRTVGERIGKTEFTYGMGASAEFVAASTILLAEKYGLPVSTTHILTSGVAGAAVGQGAGLQGRTIRNMGLAWFLTLPVAMTLSGGLYYLMLSVVRAFGHG